MALVNTTFSNLITFTRADASTCASFVGANGLIQLATANTPRFDYDPATLAPKGFLIEESRQNTQLNSAAVSSGASYSTLNANGTVTLNAATAPDGTVTATSYIEDTAVTVGRYLAGLQFTPALATNYTYSMYVKQASGSRYFAFLFLSTQGWNGGIGASAVYDLSGSGTVTSTAGGIVATSITAVGNGWYRCTATALSDATTTASGRVQFRITNSPTNSGPNYTGDGTSGFYLWGCQLEIGAFPTSYIPTTTVAVTRAADGATINPLSPWFNASEGTLVAQADTYDVSNPRISFLIYDGTSANRIQTGHGSNSRGFIAAGGINQLSQIPGSVSNNTASKVALAYKTNDGQTAVNGTASTAVTTLTVPTVTTMRLGGFFTNVNVLNGHIRNITYYPRRLSQAELITLTT